MLTDPVTPSDPVICADPVNGKLAPTGVHDADRANEDDVAVAANVA
jgi:hypothetical protein